MFQKSLSSHSPNLRSSHCQRVAPIASRRDFLQTTSHGFGALALSAMLARDAASSDQASPRSIAATLNAKPSHFPAKAKNVIFLFMAGGPSQVDTFDPKPELQRLSGQLLPPSFHADGIKLQFMGTNEGKLMGSPLPFAKYGDSGLEFSSLFPNLGKQADRMAIIRSCYHESFIHGTAINYMSTGSPLVGHPSVGSWVTYGLGCETDSLPAFMVMSDGGYRGGNGMFHSGYLPALYQGTVVRTDGSPIQNLAVPSQLGATQQRRLLDQIHRWNRDHAARRPEDSRLEARIANYELAFRMQTAAPDIVEIKNETQSTLDAYGVNAAPTARFGKMCLLARRMVEKGVRFVELMNNDWDGHSQCATNHQANAGAIDQPIAALLEDLHQRGLLESTLVVWCGEFGRTPIMQGVNGRDHSPYGFSIWMAGGGIQGGKAIGATDEFGFRAIENRVHVHDIHATILSLLGMDHTQLTYLFEGRQRRLTDIGGYDHITDMLTRS